MSEHFEEGDRLIEQIEKEISPQIKIKDCKQFNCNKCFRTAVDPILSQCGHLFCWNCTEYSSNNQQQGIFFCNVCSSSQKLKDSRIIYHGNVTFSQQKPRSMNFAPIRNSSGVNVDSAQSYRLVNNTTRYKKLAGYTLMPPNFIQNCMDQNAEQDEKQISVISKCIKNSLFLMLGVVILGLLFNIIIL